ncbi:MAG: HD domain-containing protein [Cytophagales bacterium]|nr:HD domain-containing protein [Cytophagales bacterium]
MLEEQKNLVDRVREEVKQRFSGEGSGHDWWHIHRVCQTARAIGQEEKADLFVIELGALLHDIADHKFHGGDDTVGPRAAEKLLRELGLNNEDVIRKVVAIVKEISFKGAGVPTPMSSLEGEIVQDADRLDAIGAIGIARAFAYGGFREREIHNPEVELEVHSSFESYKKGKAPTINHFYEKLLLLKDRMNTGEGKRLAEERHVYMEMYLDQFYKEWEGAK